MKKYYQILSKSRFIFFTNVLEKLVFFIFFLILARQLDKSPYGLLVTTFVFTNIINSLFELGFPSYVQREAYTNQINAEISALVTLKIIAAIVFSTILIIYLHLYLEISLIILTVIGALVYLHGFNAILISYLYGRSRYKRGFYSFLISRLFFLITALYFLITGTGDYQVLLVLFASVILHFILLLNNTAKEGLRISVKFDWSLIKTLIGRSLPFGIGGIFVLMYDKVDIILLERFINVESVAIYAVAYSFYKLPQMLSIIILTPVYTDFSLSFKENNGIKKTEIYSVTIILLSVSFLSIILIYLFGESILKILYGSKYSVSVSYLKALILALPALYFNNFTGVISNSVHKENIPMVVCGIGLLFNITFNIIGIILYGIWGAVCATIFTEYSVFVIQTVLLKINNNKTSFILQS